MAWIIETIGDLKKMIEPFDDEMRITPLKVKYVLPVNGTATLEINLYECDCQRLRDRGLGACCEMCCPEMFKDKK